MLANRNLVILMVYCENVSNFIHLTSCNNVIHSRLGGEVGWGVGGILVKYLKSLICICFCKLQASP